MTDSQLKKYQKGLRKFLEGICKRTHQDVDEVLGYIETDVANYLRANMSEEIESVYDVQNEASLTELKSQAVSDNKLFRALGYYINFLASPQHLKLRPKLGASEKRAKRDSQDNPGEPTGGSTSLGGHAPSGEYTPTQQELDKAADDEFKEGKIYETKSKEHKRNPAARLACIKKHGCKCLVCGFDFGKVYGEEAEGYIEVHHIVMISTTDGEHSVNAKEELVPLCSNCHSAIHLMKGDDGQPLHPQKFKEEFEKRNPKE